MRHYLFISLSIGAAAAALTIALSFAGVFASTGAWVAEAFAEAFAETFAVRGTSQGEEPNRVKWLEVLAVVAGTFGVAWSVVDIPRTARKISVVLAIMAVVLGLSPTLAAFDLLFDPVPPLVAVALSAGAAFAYAGTERGKRKRLLSDVLGARISLRQFDALLEATEPPDFREGSGEVSVLTCRFLQRGEGEGDGGVPPRDLVKMSNLFARTVSSFLLSKGAYLEQSGPESVRGTFGLVVRNGNHAEDACRAALELESRLRSLSQEFESRWFQPLRYGVGVGSGPVTSGVCGDPSHFYLASIGPSNDFSARLAQANLRYGSRLLVCPETYRKAGGSFEVRPMEMFFDPSASVLSEIYELLSTAEGFDEGDRARRNLYWQGMIYLREKNYEAALDHLSRSRVPGEEDGPVAYFIGRTQDGLASPESPTARLTRELTEEGHARLLTSL